MDGTAYERGAAAYRAGAPISVIPDDMGLVDYEEYRRGWHDAWEQERIEPTIVVNGVTLTQGEAMTVRVALETWAMELQDDPNCLGADEHGRRMAEGYLSAIRDIRRIMSAKPA